jgi:hypothetical protein
VCEDIFPFVSWESLQDAHPSRESSGRGLRSVAVCIYICMNAVSLLSCLVSMINIKFFLLIGCGVQRF